VAPALDPDRWRDLPGWELVEPGLADLTAGRATIPALLVSIGASRIEAAGLAVGAVLADPETTLYQLLAAHDPDSAHGRYNALIRRLVSFERAAEACATR